MRHISILRNVFLTAAVVTALASCQSTKEITYFQDVTPESKAAMAPEVREIVIRPHDEISIFVNSRDPRLTDMFNLPYITRQMGMNQSAGTNQGVVTYMVNNKGDIDFPVLGTIHIAGLTRQQVAEKIKDMLVKDKYIQDPVVTVTFANQSYLVMGEVNNPGRLKIDRDKLTLLDAITAAGDLTINGMRKNVKVVRTDGEKQETYIVDLTSAESLRTSPAFYVQQDDIIYVEPNNQRKRQSTVNGNTPLSYSFWVSVASLMVSIAVLIWK